MKNAVQRPLYCVRLYFKLKLLCDRAYKPGSVIDSHLSRHTVAGVFQPPFRERPGKPEFSLRCCSG